MACLDTCVYVDLFRTKSQHREAAARKLDDLLARGELLVTTRFNVAELYLGVHLAAEKSLELQRVRQFLAKVQIINLGRRAAWFFGKTKAFLRQQGRPIADLDLLIAATAQSLGHAVITRNLGHYVRVPGLRVETY
jgi:tRNA(fMet)-specific endonuclease VapC